MMGIPDYLHGHVHEVVMMESDGAHKRRLWAVILGLVPFRDGDQWCIMLGANVQEGVCGFGKTPEEAMWDFDKAMSKPL